MENIFIDIARDPLAWLKKDAEASDKGLALTFSGIFPLELLDGMGFRSVWLPPILRNRYTKADSMIQTFMCSRSKSFIDVLAGEDIDVAAIGAVTDCDAKDVIPGILEAGGNRVPSVTLRVPIRMDSSLSVDYSFNAVKQWVIEAQEVFGRKINAKLLAQSCALRTEARAKITSLFEGIGTEVDPVFAYAAAISSQVMEPQAFLDALGEGPWPKPENTRKMVPILLSGSEMPHIALIEELADMGAMVVLDDTETGSRASSRPAKHPHCDDAETRDSFDLEGLLEVVGAGLVFRDHGPTNVVSAGTRMQTIVSSAMHRHVKVAILGLFKFCDPHAFEAPSMIDQLKMAGVRSLVIETDKEKGLLAREKTRVQTLLESVE